jgi:hypothetical protein
MKIENILKDLISFCQDIKFSVNELEMGFGELCSTLGKEVTATDMEDWERYTIVDTMQILRDESSRLRVLFKRIRQLPYVTIEGEEETPLDASFLTSSSSSLETSKRIESLELGDSPLQEIESRLAQLLGFEESMDDEEEEEEEEDVQEVVGECVYSDDDTEEQETDEDRDAENNFIKIRHNLKKLTRLRKKSARDNELTQSEF